MRWPAPTGPKAGEGEPGTAGREDLADRYEAMRAAVRARGARRAGLGAALLIGKGMPAWMVGWRACAPVPAPPPAARPAPTAAPAEVVSVLAAMALACT